MDRIRRLADLKMDDRSRQPRSSRSFAYKVMNAVSYPTFKRRFIAAGIMAGGFALTVVVKVARGRIETEFPLWIMDSLPNFICGAVVPFAILLGDRIVRLREFILFIGLIAVGLIAYEWIQIVMPNRTFELMDLAASAAGMLVPVAVGWTLFRDDARKGDQSHARVWGKCGEDKWEEFPPK